MLRPVARVYKSILNTRYSCYVHCRISHSIIYSSEPTRNRKSLARRLRFHSNDSRLSSSLARLGVGCPGGGLNAPLAVNKKKKHYNFASTESLSDARESKTSKQQYVNFLSFYLLLLFYFSYTTIDFVQTEKEYT